MLLLKAASHLLSKLIPFLHLHWSYSARSQDAPAGVNKARSSNHQQQQQQQLCHFCQFVMDKSSSVSSSSSSKGQPGQGDATGGASTKSSRHDHYPDWDPMRGMAESLLSTVGDTQAGDGGAMGLFGGTGEMELSSILCPFNDGSGRCFKTACLYKHVPYSSKVLKELPKLESALATGQQPCNIVTSSLPHQVFPAEGCISKVVIVAAFDPGCFYVIPENGWRCLCRIHEEKPDIDISSKPSQPRNLFDALEGIQTALKKHFQDNLTSHKRTDFNTGELVAVRMSSSEGKKTWYRAKIVGDPVSKDDDDILKPVDVEVQLLDYGVRCSKSSLEIAALPEDFCFITPLAYKCQLFGISPILGTWSTSAAKAFRELVVGRYCIAEVVRTAVPIFCIGGSDDSRDSCFVNLHIKLEGENYISVAEQLIDSGFGLEWNMFPTQPHLNDILEGRAHKFALLS